MDGLVLLELFFLICPAFVAVIAWAVANGLPAPVRPAAAWLAAMVLPIVWGNSVARSGGSSWLFSIIFLVQALVSGAIVLLLERRVDSK